MIEDLSDTYAGRCRLSVEHKPHSVEYITGGDVSVKVEHVEIDDATEALG